MSAPKSEGDPAWVFILAMGVIGLIGWILWYFFRVPILEAMRYTRLGELGIINVFSGTESACIDWLRHAPTTNLTPTVQMAALTNNCFGAEAVAATPLDQALDYYNLTGHSIAAIGRRTAPYLHWPLAVLFVGFAIHAVFVSPRAKFRTRYNLESFIKVQAKIWPVISPIVDFKPAHYSARVPGSPVPDKLPLFAEALSPEEWISFHRIPVVNGIPDREATRRAFIQQLGPRWTGIEGQPLYIQSLFAAFALKGVQKREESDELLGRISTCWTADKGFHMPGELEKEIRKIMKDPAIGGEALKLAEQGAYRVTALLATLKWARWMGGVLASAQFLWLRGQDRALWYPLNNFGRRSFHSEGAGAMAHFMAEQGAKKPLPIPRVDTAMVTLNQYLVDPEKRALPIPPREEPAAPRKA